MQGATIEALNNQTVQVLLDLRGNVDGANATESQYGADGWTMDTAVQPCEWLGVTCNEAGLIVAVDLSNLGLEGKHDEVSYPVV